MDRDAEAFMERPIRAVPGVEYEAYPARRFRVRGVVETKGIRASLLPM
jgi:hypothetical protein